MFVFHLLWPANVLKLTFDIMVDPSQMCVKCQTVFAINLHALKCKWNVIPETALHSVCEDIGRQFKQKEFKKILLTT